MLVRSDEMAGSHRDAHQRLFVADDRGGCGPEPGGDIAGGGGWVMTVGCGRFAVGFVNVWEGPKLPACGRFARRTLSKVGAAFFAILTIISIYRKLERRMCARKVKEVSTTRSIELEPVRSRQNDKLRRSPR